MELSEKLHDVISALYSALPDTPIVKAAAQAAAAEAWVNLKIPVDPKDYQNHENFFVDAQAVAFLKKFPATRTNSCAKRACFETWLQAERDCYRTNAKLLFGITQSDLPDDVKDVLSVAKKWIRDLLGRCPSRDAISPRFGPGSTYVSRGERNLLTDKVSVFPECTINAVNWQVQWFSTCWAKERLFRDSPLESDRGYDVDPALHKWDEKLCSLLIDFALGNPPQDILSPVVKGNRFAFVDKTAYTKRGIAIEPSLNMFYQLGVGEYMRTRLNSVGLLPSNGKEIHSAAAREGSAKRSLCTIDLHAASDTIAYELVRCMFPPDWFVMLDSLRSPYTLFGDDYSVRLEKFSSMGNGFTFELETILFSSLVFAVQRLLGSEKWWSCFGDDIILQDSEPVVQLLYKTLAACGFTVNTEKSFHGENPFRESCGGDYFNGMDVRPVFIKSDPQTPLEWIALHNQIRNVFLKHPQINVEPVLQKIVDAVPAPCRLFVPTSFGDVGFNTDDTSRYFTREWITCRETHASGARYRLPTRALKVIHRIPELVPLDRWSADVQYLAALYGIPSSGIDSRRSLGYRIVWVPSFAGAVDLERHIQQTPTLAFHVPGFTYSG